MNFRFHPLVGFPLYVVFYTFIHTAKWVHWLLWLLICLLKMLLRQLCLLYEIMRKGIFWMLVYGLLPFDFMRDGICGDLGSRSYVAE